MKWYRVLLLYFLIGVCAAAADNGSRAEMPEGYRLLLQKSGLYSALTASSFTLARGEQDGVPIHVELCWHNVSLEQAGSFLDLLGKYDANATLSSLAFDKMGAKGPSAELKMSITARQNQNEPDTVLLMKSVYARMRSPNDFDVTSLSYTDNALTVIGYASCQAAFDRLRDECAQAHSRILKVKTETTGAFATGYGPGHAKTFFALAVLPELKEESSIFRNAEGGFATCIRLDRAYVLSYAGGDGENFFSGLVLGPYRVDGAIKGFLLKAVRPRSLFYKIGLRSGDVLERVNGMPLDSIERFNMLPLFFKIRPAVEMRAQRYKTRLLTRVRIIDTAPLK